MHVQRCLYAQLNQDPDARQHVAAMLGMMHPSCIPPIAVMNAQQSSHDENYGCVGLPESPQRARDSSKPCTLAEDVLAR